MRLIRLDGSTTWSSQSMLGVHIIVLSYLTLCMLGTFVCFLSSADFFFQKKRFQNIHYRIQCTISVNRFGSGTGQTFQVVMGLSCLQT